jgi:hypothetical protein
MPLSKTRWTATPDTPTFDEAGVAWASRLLWHGLWAPRARRRTASPLFMPSPNAIEARQHTAILASRAYHFHVRGNDWKRRLIAGPYQPLDKNPAAMKSATLVSETR